MYSSGLEHSCVSRFLMMKQFRALKVGLKHLSYEFIHERMEEALPINILFWTSSQLIMMT